MVGFNDRALREELHDVARGDGDGTGLVPSEDLQRDRLTRTAPPQRAVQRRAIGYLTTVDGQHDVAGLETRRVARTAREHAGDDHVMVHRVAEDAEPGARSHAARAAGEELRPRVEVVLGRDGE